MVVNMQPSEWSGGQLELDQRREKGKTLLTSGLGDEKGENGSSTSIVKSKAFPSSKNHQILTGEQ